MKQRVFASLIIGLALALGAASARAHEGQGGNFGMGAGIGSPTALSLEASPVPWSAFELALGWRGLDQDHLYGHLTYKVDVVRLADGPTVIVPIYLGLGAFGENNATSDWGARFPLGVNFDFRHSPVQLFAEAALEVVVVSDVKDRHPVSAGGFGGIRVWL
jgi:hypothetical protein